MKERCPAVVHVDGTARPQIVDAETNPSFHAIIRYYHELSGVPVVVNTSFNMHEEPIVCTPDDAIRSYRRGRLDNLALGPFLLGDEPES
jgi:carbamoyltransferase